MKMCIFLTIIKLLHFIAVTVAKSRMQLFSVQHLSLSLSLCYSFLDISERCFFPFLTSPLSVHCSKTSLSLKVYVWIEAWKHSRNIQILSLFHTNLAFPLVFPFCHMTKGALASHSSRMTLEKICGQSTN